MNNLQSLSELQPQIIEWARERNILFPENAPKQRLKLIEECGELAQSILKNDIKLQKDAIGDIFVVLVILAEQIGFELIIHRFSNSKSIKNHQKIFEIIDCALDCEFANISHSIDWLYDLSVDLNHDLIECANIAWNEIKDRTGKTVNGTFIKD